MILGLFKSKSNILILIIPFLVIISGISSFLNYSSICTEIPVGIVIFQEKFKYLVINYPLLLLIFNVLLITIQAFIINHYNAKHIFIEGKTYLPGILFILFSSVIMVNYPFHSIITANFFMLIGLNFLFNSYSDENYLTDTFMFGFFTGIACLFYFPYFLILIAVWIGNIIFNQFNLRKWIAHFIGFLSIAFITVSINFVFYDLNDLFKSIEYSMQSNHSELQFHDILFISFFILIIIFSFFHTLMVDYQKKIKSRKYSRFFLFISVFIVVASIFKRNYWMIMPIATFYVYLLSAYLYHRRNNFFKEIIILVIVVLIILLNIEIDLFSLNLSTI
ncbi:MAG: hypothetical protein ABIJ97_09795 [Bacteroidota bacterium]